MRCDEFENRLNAVLDARRNPADDRRLARHAEVCRNCRQLAAAMDLIGESLRWSRHEESDPRITQRVLAELATSSPAAGRPWSVWTHVTLAAAAALLAAIVLRPNEQPQPHRPVVAQTLPDAHAPAKEQLALLDSSPDVPVGELAREATSRYASLARNTQESLADVWSLWQPQPKAATSGAPAAPAGEPLLTEMAAGLRPLAESTSGAMGFLLNLLPQGEASQAVPDVRRLDAPASQTAT